MPAYNTGFASGGLTCKLGVLYVYSSSGLIDSLVVKRIYHQSRILKLTLNIQPFKETVQNQISNYILIGSGNKMYSPIQAIYLKGKLPPMHFSLRTFSQLMAGSRGVNYDNTRNLNWNILTENVSSNENRRKYMISDADIDTALTKALDSLIARDGWLLQQDLSEQSISHRLACYLDCLYRSI